MVQGPVCVVEKIALRGADLVVVGSTRPDKPVHAFKRDVGRGPKQPILVILQVKIQRNGALAQIGHALGVIGAGFCPAQRGQKQRG